jgi:hypothetical protein
MPTESSFDSVEIPKVDLWGLMFDRKERGFSDDQGTHSADRLMNMCSDPQASDLPFL